MSDADRTPRRATRLLEWLLDGDDAGELIGDLHELHAERFRRTGTRAANRWYWGQVSRLAIVLGPRRLLSSLFPSGLLDDATNAVRALRRSPGLVTTAVITLGLGIGGPTTMYGIYAGMFSPLPVNEPHEIVDVSIFSPQSGSPVSISTSEVEAWRRETSTFEALAAYRFDEAAVSEMTGNAERRSVSWIDPTVLQILETQPILGRSFTRAEALGRDVPTVLIGERFWEERFARSSGALGTALRIDGVVHTIVGVLPADFGFPQTGELWPILVATEERSVQVVGRLADGVRAAAAQSELTALIRGSEISDEVTGTTALVDDFVMTMIGRDTEGPLRVFYWVMSALIIIAAADVAALMLARGAVRSPEIAVRMAIGGSRARVARQLVVESLWLSLGGAVLGLLFAHVGLDWFQRMMEVRQPLPYWTRFWITPEVLLFAISSMTLAVLVAGLMPAFRSSRIDLSGAMRPGAVRDRTRGVSRLLPTLVAVEVTLSCALLVLCGIMVRAALSTILAGATFPTDGVVTARFVMESYDYPTDGRRADFVSALSASLDADQSIASFSIVTALPGDGTGTVPTRIDGVLIERDQDVPRVQQRFVDENFFPMFDMVTLQGRELRDSDADGEVLGVVVNEAFVRDQVRDGFALGRGLTFGSGDEMTRATIVGVVDDRGASVDDGQPTSAFFVPIAAAASDARQVAVRGLLGRPPPLEGLRSSIVGLDPNMPLGRVLTLGEVVARENQSGRVLSLLFGGFGAAALLLALVGLHGVVSFSASQRTRDIGVMRALGARPARVIGSTLTRGLRPVLVGIVLGEGIALGLAPTVTQGFVGSGRLDPMVFVLVPGALLLASMVAAALPARRAFRVDPVDALRAE